MCALELELRLWLVLVNISYGFAFRSVSHEIVILKVCDMSAASSKGHESVMEDPVVDLFQVEVPLEPKNLLKVSSLANVSLELEKAKCLPAPRTLITNIVTSVKGVVRGVQLMLLDPQSPVRVSCSAGVLFPKAPETAKITLTKRCSEFYFKPGTLVSDWVDAGKLDFQVIELLF